MPGSPCITAPSSLVAVKLDDQLLPMLSNRLSPDDVELPVDSPVVSEVEEEVDEPLLVDVEDPDDSLVVEEMLEEVE